MSENTYQQTCDMCDETYPKTDEKSILWTNAGFCSTVCKQRWVNLHDKNL